jgi:glycosyltransferase involved in cell wall biosynthesis
MKTNINDTPPGNLICFSHLRWDFVYQRPQHLLSRFAKASTVWFFEEPVFDAREQNYLSIKTESPTLNIVLPHLLPGLNEEEIIAAQAKLLKQLTAKIDLDDCLFWYYTPMALKFSMDLKPKAIVYDCMDELSAFKFAPKEMLQLEKQLMDMADIVFTGGHSLFEAKKTRHANIHAFPSGIEKEHFEKARTKLVSPADQADITGPKIGFYGVIDERFDIDLIEQMAIARPHWQFILIGPVVKIDPAHLPKNKNIHYLGQKSYAELPEYLSNWNVAMIPFLLNESTEFISPTKTPEYLSAGVPVVSSPIKDVTNPYGITGLVHICSTPDQFIRAIESELNKGCQKAWLKKVDQFLKGVSWDITYSAMNSKICQTMNRNKISIAS